MTGRRSIGTTLDEVKSLADKLRQNSPALLEELKTIAKNPRAMSSWIEQKSPWLSRRFLGAASNLAEPFTAGMGMSVEKLGEDAVEISLPGHWRNQSEAGSVHSAAIMVVGEFTVRTYWEYHLDIKSSEFSARRIQVRVLARPSGDLKAIFRMAAFERESILQQLRASGSVALETEAQIYDSAGLLVAEVDLSCELKRQLALKEGK